MGQEIKSLSLGIIGLGRLGKFMAHFGKSFGMKLAYYNLIKHEVFLTSLKMN